MEEHTCGKIHNGIEIYNNDDNEWLLNLNGNVAEINYCPSCGIKLEEKRKQHRCPQLLKKIENNDFENDLKIYYNPEYETWVVYHDGQQEFSYFDCCPFCGELLE